MFDSSTIKVHPTLLSYSKYQSSGPSWKNITFQGGEIATRPTAAPTKAVSTCKHKNESNHIPCKQPNLKTWMETLPVRMLKRLEPQLSLPAPLYSAGAVCSSWDRREGRELVSPPIKTHGQLPERLRPTVQHRLVQTPVDTQTVLLPLHASFTLAAVQRSGQQRRHGALALVPRPRPQLHAAVPGHTLPEGAQPRAAGVVAGAGVPGTQAVPPGHRQRHTRDSCETRRTEDGSLSGPRSANKLKYNDTHAAMKRRSSAKSCWVCLCKVVKVINKTPQWSSIFWEAVKWGEYWRWHLIFCCFSLEVKQLRFGKFENRESEWEEWEE